MSSNDAHKRFLENLDASVAAVWSIAKWLQSHGYAVTVNPIRKAPAHEQWKEYVDHGNIEIRRRVEVKHLSVNFTGRQDWLFGSKFLVCAKHSFDHITPKPYAYVIVSADFSACAIVHSSTSDKWTIESRQDVRHGDDYQQEFYLCPIDLVKWSKI
jgi:hypothetical protein